MSGIDSPERMHISSIQISRSTMPLVVWSAVGRVRAEVVETNGLQPDAEHQGRYIGEEAAMSARLQQIYDTDLRDGADLAYQHEVGVGYQYDDAGVPRIVLTTPPAPSDETVDLNATNESNPRIATDHFTALDVLMRWLER
jgi:hypothetical protein